MKQFILFSFFMLHLQLSFGQCADQLHTPFFEDGWLSCEQTVNPNPVRPMSHWIQFDLGFQYSIDSIYIWNYNFWGYEDLSVKRVAIDYSTDGLLWNNAGEFEIQKSSGSHKYSGALGPVLDKIDARFVLFTVLENWNSELPCAGLAEVKFGLVEQTTSSLDPNSKDYTINLSPNPAVDHLLISISPNALPDQIQLLDINGKYIRTFQWIGESNQSISVHDLIPGVYIVQMWFGNQIVSKRFVKVE